MEIHSKNQARAASRSPHFAGELHAFPCVNDVYEKLTSTCTFAHAKMVPFITSLQALEARTNFALGVVISKSSIDRRGNELYLRVKVFSCMQE